MQAGEGTEPLVLLAIVLMVTEYALSRCLHCLLTIRRSVLRSPVGIESAHLPVKYKRLYVLQALLDEWRAEVARKPLAMSEADACKVLGLKPGADGVVPEDDLKSAYRSLARKYVIIPDCMHSFGDTRAVERPIGLQLTQLFTRPPLPTDM